MKLFTLLQAVAGCALAVTAAGVVDAAESPNIIFVMADDMGWGQTGYYKHPILATPNLDAMASGGLRFDRFYAGAPVCSPTRATVLTGRSNDRSGTLSHGYALRLQEKTVAQALQKAGYTTGHFGKWHLNARKGPGVPLFADDPYGPGVFGFDHWVSTSNFFDINPLMSREGNFEQFEGDSSEVAMAEAIRFIEKSTTAGHPFFAVVWFGTPHAPFRALPEDGKDFSELDEDSLNHHGELVAMDRSIGSLRGRLRELEIADDTMLVFCSDNGGLPKITPDTTGGLRGNKGTIFEGGLRVPAIIEWPRVIDQPRVTSFPACTTDLFPTVAEIVGIASSEMVSPVDGISLRGLFDQEIARRNQPIGFRWQGRAALIDNDHKILSQAIADGSFELYDLAADPTESNDLRESHPELFVKLRDQLIAWNDSVSASFEGKDYPEGVLNPPDTPSISWSEDPRYAPYLAEWADRWEYRSTLRPDVRPKPSAQRSRAQPTRAQRQTP